MTDQAPALQPAMSHTPVAEQPVTEQASAAVAPAVADAFPTTDFPELAAENPVEITAVENATDATIDPFGGVVAPAEANPFETADAPVAEAAADPFAAATEATEAATPMADITTDPFAAASEAVAETIDHTAADTAIDPFGPADS